MADGVISQIQALIRQLQGALGGKAVRVGAGTATWTASTTSADKVITHGLGRVPVVAAAFQIGNSPTLLYGATAVGAATFTVTGFYTDHETGGNLTGTFSFGWVAIG